MTRHVQLIVQKILEEGIPRKPIRSLEIVTGMPKSGKTKFVSKIKEIHPSFRVISKAKIHDWLSDSSLDYSFCLSVLGEVFPKLFSKGIPILLDVDMGFCSKDQEKRNLLALIHQAKSGFGYQVRVHNLIPDLLDMMKRVPLSKKQIEQDLKSNSEFGISLIPKVNFYYSYESSEEGFIPRPEECMGVPPFDFPISKKL